MKNKAEVDSRYNKSDTMVSFSEMTACSLIIYFLVSYDGDDGDDELFLWLSQLAITFSKLTVETLA